MERRIFAQALIFASVVLFLGAASILGVAAGQDGGIVITNASFAAPSPEKENLNDEWVEISNQGTSDVNLTGWTLEDGQNHTYTFPDFSLKAYADVVLHTGIGSDTFEDLYWNRKTAIWNNDGDVATLKDASGAVVSSYPGEETGT
jgi:competence protein ComEC